MTITYNDQFFKQLFRWKASIWKSILPPLVLYLTVYYIVYIPLVLVLDCDQKKSFAKAQQYCKTCLDYFPITFILGFYVSHAVSRWWQQFMLIPYPDKFMYMLCGYASESTAEIISIRRNIGRWINLMGVLYYQTFSKRILKRFPTLQSIVEIGLMTAYEKETYAATAGPYGKTGVIQIWIQKAINDLQKQGYINTHQQVQLYEELAEYRGGLSKLTLYDWAPEPLVYTQVVTLATLGYFLIAMFANMNLMITDNCPQDPPVHSLYNIHVPLFLITQFFFYMGWLRVAQHLFDPFGEDDDDFEMNYIIDRNASVSEAIATDMASSWPGYSWASTIDTTKLVPLAYSIEALKKPGHFRHGKLEGVSIKEKNREIVNLSETEQQLEAGHYHDEHHYCFAKPRIRSENK